LGEWGYNEIARTGSGRLVDSSRCQVVRREAGRAEINRHSQLCLYVQSCFTEAFSVAPHRNFGMGYEAEVRGLRYVAESRLNLKAIRFGLRKFSFFHADTNLQTTGLPEVCKDYTKSSIPVVWHRFNHVPPFQVVVS